MNNNSRDPPEEELFVLSTDGFGREEAAEIGAEVCRPDNKACVHFLKESKQVLVSCAVTIATEKGMFAAVRAPLVCWV